MALNGFLSKCPITFPRTQIGTNTITDFPVVMNQSNFPPELFSGTTGCAIDGRDIRFTSDSSGTTELPRDIINIDTSNGICVIRCLVPTLNGTGETSDTIIYLWWNNINADEPGNTSDSNKFKVYTNNYYGVYDFQDVELGWKGVRDSSGQYSNSTVTGTISRIDGHISGTTSLVLSSTFGIILNEYMQMTDESNFELQFWSNHQGTYTSGPFMVGQNGITIEWSIDQNLKVGYSATALNNGEPASGWVFHTVKIGTTIDFYRDGVSDAGFSNGLSPLDNMANLGGNTGCPTFLISGVKIIRDTVSPLNWQPVIYNNESNINNFSSAGTVETVTSAASLTLTNLKVNTEIVVLESISRNELLHIEDSSTGYTWNYTYIGDVDIKLVSLNYVNISILNLTLIGNDIVIPIQQQIDRWYDNP